MRRNHDVKEHVKLYKSKKNWVAATVFTTALGITGVSAVNNVSANSVSSSSSSVNSASSSQVSSSSVKPSSTVTLRSNSAANSSSTIVKSSSAQSSSTVANNLKSSSAQSSSTVANNLKSSSVQSSSTTVKSNSTIASSQGALNASSSNNNVRANFAVQPQVKDSSQSSSQLTQFTFPSDATRNLNNLSKEYDKYQYVSNPADKNVIINDITKLSPEVQKDINVYGAELIDPFLKGVYQDIFQAKPKYLVIDNASMQLAQAVADNYTADHWIEGEHDFQHDQDAIVKASEKYHVYGPMESSTPYGVIDTNKPVTLDDVKHSIYDVIHGMLYNDADELWGHMKNLVGIYTADDGSVHLSPCYFGLAFDKMGQLHILNMPANSYWVDPSSPIYTELTKEQFKDWVSPIPVNSNADLVSEKVSTPAENQPADKPSVNTPVASKPTTTTPSVNTPVANKPATTKPSVNTPVASKPATTKPSVNTPVASKPATTKPSVNTPVASKPATTPSVNNGKKTDDVLPGPDQIVVTPTETKVSNKTAANLDYNHGIDPLTGKALKDETPAQQQKAKAYVDALNKDTNNATASSKQNTPAKNTENPVASKSITTNVSNGKKTDDVLPGPDQIVVTPTISSENDKSSSSVAHKVVANIAYNKGIDPLTNRLLSDETPAQRQKAKNYVASLNKTAAVKENKGSEKPVYNQPITFTFSENKVKADNVSKKSKNTLPTTGENQDKGEIALGIEAASLGLALGGLSFLKRKKNN